MSKKEKFILVLSLFLIVLMISSGVYSFMNRLDDIVFFDHEIAIYEGELTNQGIYYVTHAGDSRQVVELSFDDNINFISSSEYVRNFGLYDLHVAYFYFPFEAWFEAEGRLDNPTILDSPTIILSNGEVMTKNIGSFYMINRKDIENQNHDYARSSSDGNFDIFRFAEPKTFVLDEVYLSEKHYEDWLLAYDTSLMTVEEFDQDDFVSLKDFKGVIKADKRLAIASKSLSKNVVYSTGVYFKEVDASSNKGIFLHFYENPNVDLSIIKKIIKSKSLK